MISLWGWVGGMVVVAAVLLWRRSGPLSFDDHLRGRKAHATARVGEPLREGIFWDEWRRLHGWHHRNRELHRSGGQDSVGENVIQNIHRSC